MKQDYVNFFATSLHRVYKNLKIIPLWSEFIPQDIKKFSYAVAANAILQEGNISQGEGGFFHKTVRQRLYTFSEERVLWLG